MKVKKLLISHFYNEEYLLPFWINHHHNIFSDAVLINNNSTDMSVQIIKELAPNWSIINSPMKKFDSAKTDELIMKIENDYIGYSKIVLNTTEFLMIDKLAIFDDTLQKFKMNQLHTFIACSKESNEKIKNLILEEKIGFWDDNFNILLPYIKFNWGLEARKRFIHSHPTGLYKPGRHITLHKKVNLISRDIAHIRWYSLSPWNKDFINRKLQIQKSISQEDIKNHFSYHHFITKENLNERKNYFMKISEEYPGNLKNIFYRKFYVTIRFILRVYNFLSKRLIK